MRQLEFDKSVTLSSAIDAIKSVPEKDLTVRLDPQTPWVSNPVNKKILRKAAQGFGKTLHFEGEDLPDEQLAAPQASTPAVSPSETVPPESISESQASEDNHDSGFVEGTDIAAPVASPALQTAALRPQAEPDVTPISKPLFTNQTLGSGNKIRLLGSFLRRHWIFSITGGVAIVLLLLAYTVFFLPKADVKILVESRSLESSATITATTTVTSADTKNHLIPALAKTSTESGNQSAQTTGSKVTGTKATGTATLYNNTDFSKTISAGASVTAASSAGSLKFAVVNTVTLPKRNSMTGVPTGVDVSVTASDIGDKYNVTANTAFTLDADPADIKGVNSTAFTGGSSKTIQVVAQADQDKLIEGLTASLTDKAKSDVSNQVGKDYQIQSDGIKISVGSKSFDHPVGDQADQLTLNLTITATATVYKSGDLKDMLISSLESNVPDGFQVDKNNVQTSADLANVADNGDLTFAGHIKASLTPKFDENAIAQQLSGKKPSAADAIIKALPSVVSYHISFWPNLPDILKTFPRDPHRIHITVSSQ